MVSDEGASTVLRLRVASLAIALVTAAILVAILVAARSISEKNPVDSSIVVGSAMDIPSGQSKVPEFTLFERSGKKASSVELDGRVWIAGFVFTRCHETCPMVTNAMARLRRILPKDVQLVTFSVDPRYDTPDVLTDYAKRYTDDKDSWWFLTGDRDMMHELFRVGFHVPVADNPDPSRMPGELVSHTTRLALVDRKGNIRGYFDATDPVAMERLIDQAKTVGRESR